MAGWFKHDIAAWMDATESLDHEPYRVYHVTCQLIYQNEGPIRRNDSGIAGRCNMSVRAYKKAIDFLISEGLITEKDGRLSNSRAEKELGLMETNRKNASKGGKARAKALENNDASQATLRETPALRLEETRLEEKKKDGADAPVLFDAPIETKPKSAEEQAKKELYSEFNKLFNGAGGGMATKLLRAKGGNVWQAMAALGAAKDSGDPRSYIGGILKSAQPYSPIM